MRLKAAIRVLRLQLLQLLVEFLKSKFKSITVTRILSVWKIVFKNNEFLVNFYENHPCCGTVVIAIDIYK